LITITKYLLFLLETETGLLVYLLPFTCQGVEEELGWTYEAVIPMRALKSLDCSQVALEML
jgi:hypothetical protein